MKDLKKKIALVTGGGQGLGKEICTVLAEEGAHVIAADIQIDRVTAVADELKKKGYDATGIEMNVADDASVEKAFAEIEKTYGALDILVNNAGIDVTKPIHELSMDEFDRVQKVNIRGPFMIAKHALPKMYEKKAGHVINIVSTSGLRGWQDSSAAYCASKFALRGLSQVMFVEARIHGVKVSSIIAGGMRTPFILERFPDVPLDKLQEPRNVAEAVRSVLTLPDGSIIPELLVVPLQEAAWP